MVPAIGIPEPSASQHVACAVEPRHVRAARRLEPRVTAVRTTQSELHESLP